MLLAPGVPQGVLGMLHAPGVPGVSRGCCMVLVYPEVSWVCCLLLGVWGCPRGAACSWGALGCSGCYLLLGYLGVPWWCCMLLGCPGVILAPGVPQGCPEGAMCLCGVASVSLLAPVISVLQIKRSCQGLPLRVSVASKELSKGTALSLTPATQSVPFSDFL